MIPLKELISTCSTLASSFAETKSLIATEYGSAHSTPPNPEEGQRMLDIMQRGEKWGGGILRMLGE